MKYAFADRAFTSRLYIIARKPGESRKDYLIRFLYEIRGYGNGVIYTIKGNKPTRRFFTIGETETWKLINRIKKSL